MCRQTWAVRSEVPGGDAGGGGVGADGEELDGHVHAACAVRLSQPRQRRPHLHHPRRKQK
eukprot:1334789-Rhodomonas_salina.1